MQLTLFRDHPAEGWPSMDRYAEQLAAALGRVAPPSWQITMPMPPPPLRGAYGSIVSRTIVYPRWARRQQGDLNHLLDHSYGALLLGLDRSRTLVTVHDIAPLRIPGRRLGISGLAWRLAWQQVRRARAILTDSAFMGQELRSLGLNPPLMGVAHLGVSPALHPLPIDRTAFARQFGLGNAHVLLHVGSTLQRKNLPVLLEALALVRSRGTNAILLQAGGSPTNEQQALIAELQLDAAVRFLGKVTEATLAALYSASDLFVFPSLYEGFGLPVIEAMACGTPVVCGNTTSLPEVAGDAAILVDARSPAALAEAIARILHNTQLAATLRRQGLARARQFSWQNTARATLDMYRKL